MSKTNNKNKVRKGDYGYIASRKKETDSHHGSSVRSTASDLFFSNDLL